MLSENIKTLRKQKGYSQEQLADKLNVVRQTVSKWEKGYSVPDADMLEDMADIFEVQVNELLGGEIITEEETSDIGELAKQLRIFNEYLAEKVRRRKIRQTIFKRCISVICIIAILFSTYIVAGFVASKWEQIFRGEASIALDCTLEDKIYNVQISYWQDNGEIHGVQWSGGSPEEINNILEGSPGSDKTAQAVANEVESYFTKKGGTCQAEYHEKTLEDVMNELF